MNEGAWSSRLGIAGQPALAEEAMLARDLALVRLTGAPMHFLHLSTAGSVEMIRRAKADGLAVTAEVTPHHLALCDAAVAGFDPVYKVNPPLRTALDVAAVREGVVDGVVDAIATDHAPHAPERKEDPFDEAPAGMLGLETALSVAYSALCAGPEERRRRGRCRLGATGSWSARVHAGPLRLVLLAAGSHRRARPGSPGRRGQPWRSGRPTPARRGREPHGVRPELRMGRGPEPPGQPEPQHALCRSPAHRQGPAHGVRRRGRGPRRRVTAMNEAPGPAQ